MMKMEVNELNLVKDKAFAIIQLKPGSEIKLLKMLIENGYTNVSFTNGTEEMLDEEKEDEEVDVETVNDNEENESKTDTKAEAKEIPVNYFQGHSFNGIGTNANSQLQYPSLTLPTVLWPNYPLCNPFLQGSSLPMLSGPVSDTIGAMKCDIPYMSEIDTDQSIDTNGHSAQSQLLADTPPSTPRGSSNESSFLVNGARLRQRGRQLRVIARESSAYATCRLCRNRILANRLSNLHNHVRRHAILKQFHCRYCSYAHTEVAKVRLHMLHNHKDDRSQPLDKRNEDMEAAWALLMKECFPGYA